MKGRAGIAIFILIFIAGAAGLQAQQQETAVVVRAQAKDAKFIGDGMGGAMITIIESATGDTLARGLTKGETGDTDRLVREPVKRYEQLSTPGAAAFEARLMLSEPMLVTIEATAPWGEPHARISSSVQQWLIPGKNITGDGIIIEVPGFVINNQLPNQGITYSAGQSVPIRSHIVMMCGCPTSDGGLWDSSAYDIEAHIIRNDVLQETVDLTFTGQTSLFEGSFVPSEQGRYRIRVTAFHPQTGNAGVAETLITVE